jgi:hypothetical protein
LLLDHNSIQINRTGAIMKLSLATLLSASALVAAVPVAEPEPALHLRATNQSIDAGMKAKGKKYFGTCSDPGRFNSGQTGAVIKANFGQITPENRYVLLTSVLWPVLIADTV